MATRQRRMKWCGITLLALALAASPAMAAGEYKVNSPVARETFGELVDFIRVGHAHWSAKSGDPKPDVFRGAKDVDDSFGEHKGSLTKDPGAKFGTFALYPGNELRATLNVPGGGTYILALQGMTGKANRHELEYKRGGEWVKLPTLSGDADWPKGWQVKIFCFAIEAAPGQKEIPIKLRSIKQRLNLQGIALAKPRQDPFDGFKPATKAAHPSLLFDAAGIAPLREKLTGHPFCSKMYKQVRNIGYAATMMDKGQLDKPGYRVGLFRGFLLNGSVSAAIMNDEKNLAISIRLIGKALDWESWGATLNSAGMVRTMSIAYDCLYEKLDPQLREKMRRRIDREAAKLYLEAITGAWWGVDTRANNWQAVCNSAIGLAGLALRGESRYAEEYLEWGKKLTKVYLRTTLAADGSCREAYGSYFNYGVGTAFSFLVMLKNATGEDLLSFDNNVLAGLSEYSLYLLYPQRDGFCIFDDTDFGYHMNGIGVVAGLAMYKQDPLAQWLLRKYGGEDSQRNRLPGWRPWEKMFTLLWYDTKLQPEDPETSPRTPLARAYIDDGEPGLRRWSSGHVIMRTGFASKDDIVLMTQCGDAGGYHGHADQGAFTFDAYGGHLVGDVGKYGGYGGIGNNWAHGDSSHSVVMIDGKGQVSNHRDGDGRMERDGTVDSFVHHPGVADYALANSKPAYDAGKNPVTRAMRHFLFVRKPNRRGYLVVADDIAKPGDGEHEYSWRLHGTHFHAPVLDQDKARFRFAPSDDNYWKRGGSFAEGGKGTLQVLFATPKSPTLSVVKSEKVGGWYDGKPGPPEGTDTFFPPYVKADVTARRGAFLVLLYPESEPLGVKMPLIQRFDSPNYAGFVVGEDLILFGKADGTITHGNVETDARLLYLTGDGDGRQFLAAGATYLAVDGKKLFVASQPITLALDAEGKGVADGPAEGYVVTLKAGRKIRLKGRSPIE